MVVPKRALVIGGVALVAVIAYSSNTPPPGGTEPASSPAGCRVAVTADVLNVRAAPDAAAEIVGKFRQGAESDADRQVQNGFRKLGPDRWAATEFLKPLDGRDCG